MGLPDTKRDKSPSSQELMFSSVLPADHELTPLRPWTSIPAEELQNEVIRRNGPFQIMLGFMRHLFHASVVLDASGRIIFINHAMEIYWQLNFWDIQGKPFAEIMQLNEFEAERNAQKRERATSGRFPNAFLEGFHQGKHDMTMCCFPFADSTGDLLLGAFILPHPPGPSLLHL
jgi:transcriptional regulator with PAS, ATPase and Fis domain